MIAAVLLMAIPLQPLAELPPQALAPNSCAMFLWDRGTGRRILMRVAQPPTIRINSGGIRTLAQRDASGAPVMGFAPRSSYADGALTVSLNLLILPNPASVGGASIREGVMTITGADGEAIVSPVAGLIGCQTASER